MEFSNVEIKGVDLDEAMVRAVAKQAERVRRTRVIHTEGALHAAETFLHPARQLAQPLRALQPRYMQALTEMAGGIAQLWCPPCLWISSIH